MDCSEVLPCAKVVTILVIIRTVAVDVESGHVKVAGPHGWRRDASREVAGSWLEGRCRGDVRFGGESCSTSGYTWEESGGGRDGLEGDLLVAGARGEGQLSAYI